ncbi:MAG: helix-turn-helix domain-containing protein, partial [Chitinophagaceae bacterium]|nr:helix-turn-helix domain-containing protein [Chitinophagaceae bacterium]
ATQFDLVQLAKDVIDTYQQISRKRNIDCRLLTKFPSLMVWADNGMIDKVLFNLISNAFKFTPDHGSISVRIDKFDNYARIIVEDTGSGMSEDVITHAFDLFYQGSADSHKGSGLGLALCKELIQLHHGTISASSAKKQGTVITIALPEGNAHFNKDELAHPVNPEETLNEVDQYYTVDLLPVFQTRDTEKNQSTQWGNKPLLLLVDDNPELRGFIKIKLQEEFDILEAADGMQGVEQVFEFLPDLIVCDVMMPGKDGNAFLKVIKADIRTAHIPVILLTAMTSREQQIEGFRNQADAYIIKPFDFGVLTSTIRSLLANRSKVKGHVSANIPANLRVHTSKKSDLKFISDFRSIVENNIPNENFSVEAICRELGISKVQLYRKVKALLDININEYILQVRLQKAKYYLQHENISVAEVASKTGFSSPTYFSTVFKNKEGVSPSVFKGGRSDH